MANHDDLWSEALQEAYASAPTEEVILHTLELRHPSFPDGTLRVVSDYGQPYSILGEMIDGHYLWIENTAPAHAGQLMFFQSCAFEITLPEQAEQGVPTVEISLDNVTPKIMEYLDAAVLLRQAIQVTYREYLASDPTTSQFVLGGLEMMEVRSTLTKVTGSARFSDLVNKNFPSTVYRPSEYRGLVQ